MTKRLIDVYDDPFTTGGLFSILNTFAVPWVDDMDATTLDTEYFYNISGQKIISPLVRRVLGTDAVLDNTKRTKLADVIFKMNALNWSKQYETLSLEYDPISNYDMTESESIENENSREKTNTGTQTNSGTQTVNTTSTGTSENEIYGFNSQVAVGDRDTTTGGTVSATSTDSNTRTDNLSEGETGDSTTTRTLTRSGNIGVTTSQQMVQSQRDLWLWNFFYNIVFPDIDRILTLSTYQR